ncbi:hypothetical protein CLF_108620 [Clonorchis sinensis]|uniref:Uncharacterized protein n=1 Tax=Clonorchis sinensis TaxID=79923 RepID=G7YI97_CLOSI|nr:hypothetical protein CLF_108620 [Clonorchis sinensis]
MKVSNQETCLIENPVTHTTSVIFTIWRLHLEMRKVMSIEGAREPFDTSLCDEHIGIYENDDAIFHGGRKGRGGLAVSQTTYNHEFYGSEASVLNTDVMSIFVQTKDATYLMCMQVFGNLDDFSTNAPLEDDKSIGCRQDFTTSELQGDREAIGTIATKKFCLQLSRVWRQIFGNHTIAVDCVRIVLASFLKALTNNKLNRHAVTLLELKQTLVNMGLIDNVWNMYPYTANRLNGNWVLAFNGESLEEKQGEMSIDDFLMTTLRDSTKVDSAFLFSVAGHQNGRIYKGFEEYSVISLETLILIIIVIAGITIANRSR